SSGFSSPSLASGLVAPGLAATSSAAGVGLGARLLTSGLGDVMSAPHLGRSHDSTAHEAAGGLSRRISRLRQLGRATAPMVSQGELAVAADLIAASLRAGAPVGVAVLATAETLAGLLSPTLSRIGQGLRMGVPAQEAWHPLATMPQARRVVNAAKRSAESGAALSGALTRCADDLRAD